ncbi:MAG TPA: hypothetical protein HPP72_14960, partial [Gammaproteobacteria bacterium]|nr:hypothetical protein [Gammaproteobacteria bacterium]
KVTLHQVEQRLEQLILEQSGDFWEYYPDEGHFTPSKEWNILTKNNATPNQSGNLMTQIHPDDRGKLKAEFQRKSGFFSLICRVNSDSNHYQWVHTLGQIKTIPGQYRRYIIGKTVVISSEKGSQSVDHAATIEYQHLQQLTSLNKVAQSSNMTLMNQLMQRLLSTTHPFILLSLTVDGLDHITHTSGDSAAHQAVLECFNRLERVLKQDHRIFITSTTRQWLIIVFGRTSKEALDALKQGVQQALSFDFSPSMARGRLTASVEGFHYPQQRALIEALLLEVASGNSG